MAAAGIAALTAALAGYWLELRLKTILAAGLLLALAVLLILFAVRKFARYRMLCAVIAVLTAIGVLMRSYFFFDVRYEEALRFSGENRSVSGIVLERTGGTGFYSSYLVELNTVNGEKCRCRAGLFCTYAADLQPGFSFFLENAAAEPVTAAAGENAASALADGRFLSLTSEDPESCLITGEKTGNPGILAKRLNDRLSARLVSGLGREAGGLAAAMLLRNTRDLSDAFRRDFSRAGISHLLAVSGLHFSIITGLLGWALKKLRLPIPARTVCVGIFSLLYLALLGFPVSAVRSFLMLAVVFGTRLSGFDSDGVNSLGIACTVILLVSPGSFLDLGFVLSFCAVLGITAIFPSFTEGKGAERTDRFFGRWFGGMPEKRAAFLTAAVKRCSAAVGTVLCANLLTLLPLSAAGGELSLMALPVNLIACPLASGILTLSMLYLPAARVPFVSGYAAFLLRKVLSLLTGLAGGVSAMRNITMSLSADFVPWILIPATALTLLLLVVRLRHRWICFLPALTAAAAFAVCLAVVVPRQSPALTFLSTSENDYAVICGEGKSVVIDASDGSFGSLRDVMDYTSSLGSTETEVLVLTHYHLPHEGSVVRILEQERVRQLWLPYPQNPTELEVLRKLCAEAEKSAAACRCVVYRPGEKLTVFGSVTLELSGRKWLKRSTHPVFGLDVSDGKRTISYLSASAWEEEAAAPGADGDTLILGSHGPAVRIPPEFPSDYDTVVILGEDRLYALIPPAIPSAQKGSFPSVIADAAEWSCPLPADRWSN